MSLQVAPEAAVEIFVGGVNGRNLSLLASIGSAVCDTICWAGLPTGPPGNCDNPRSMLVVGLLSVFMALVAASCLLLLKAMPKP